MRRGVGRSVSVGGRVRTERAQLSPSRSIPQASIADSRGLIARFFIDLRRVLRLTLPQAAQLLQVRPKIIEALESGQVEYLPPWPETARFVLAYASMAGVDGGAVLDAMAAFHPDFARRAPRGEHGGRASQAGAHFLRAGTAIANGAKRLPKDAIQHISRRPERALYALSLPLGLILLMLHSSLLDVVSAPFSASVRWMSGYFQEHFGPVRDGLRYIEVDDPRSRRADKLRIGSGSY